MKHRLVVIPDTQVMVRDEPHLFDQMVSELLQFHSDQPFDAVVQLGDLVDGGAIHMDQFETVDAGLDRVYQAGLPLLLAVGNHDYDLPLVYEGLGEATENMRALEAFNQYFGPHKLDAQGLDYQLFQEGAIENFTAVVDGMRYLILEFAPRDEVVEWAHSILQANEEPTIFITHTYLGHDGRHVDETHSWTPKKYHVSKYDNDGSDLWPKLVSQYPQIIATFSGHHVDGVAATLESQGQAGNTVIQIFRNWQTTELGGAGRFCLVDIDTDNRQLEMRVYNPTTRTYEDEPGYGYRGTY